MLRRIAIMLIEYQLIFYVALGLLGVLFGGACETAGSVPGFAPMLGLITGLLTAFVWVRLIRWVFDLS